MNVATVSDSWERFKDRVWLLAFVLVVMWGVEAIDASFGSLNLNQYGIRPHQKGPWLGILLAPFLHQDFNHLAANSVPFLVLGGLVILRKIGDFVLATIAAMLIGGLGVWVVGDVNEIHLGASGVVFGYLGFLLVRALFEHSLASLAFALVAAILYGGLLAGVLPEAKHISWQGHLFGLLGGGIAGWLRAAEYRADNKRATATALPTEDDELPPKP